MIDDRRHLLQELLQAVGIGPVLALAEWRGGVLLYVPRDIDAEHEICRTLGSEAAAWLARMYGGSYVKVPRAVAYLRRLRDVELVQRRAAGESARELALRYRIDQRSVWRILAEMEAGDQQGGSSQMSLL